MATKYGIDVSEWNGDFNFGPYKDHFVIIRMGVGQSSGNNFEDARFRSNVQKCKGLGIPIGLYFFSYSYTAAMAQTQADWVYNIIKDMDLPYGIWIDIEDVPSEGFNRTPAQNKAVAQAFCQRLKDRGITARIGIYASASYFGSGNLGDLNNWYRWVAEWFTSHSSVTNTWIWQFTNAYRGFNLDGNQYVGNDPSGGDEPVPDPGGASGKKKSSSTSKGKSKNKTLDEYVWDVVKGKYGNGETRKKKLGSLYNKVQDRLNYLWDLSTKVIRGDYGNGKRREHLLGANYDIVQKIVNHRLGVK